MQEQKTYTFDEAYEASLKYFNGDEVSARVWVNKFARKDNLGHLLEKDPSDMQRHVAKEIASQLKDDPKKANEDGIYNILESLRYVSPSVSTGTEIVEDRPQVLECDVVRFQNNKEKWVAFVGLLNGHPYEIFTGLQDDDEGIMLPKSVTHGKIIKQTNPDGSHRYDFQFENKRGYKTTVEGLSEKFNPEYWNYAKLISGVLRYRMPIDHVIKLVSSLQLKSENINTWKNGVERALKKYIADGTAVKGQKCPVCGEEHLVYQDGHLVCSNCGATL